MKIPLCFLLVICSITSCHDDTRDQDTSGDYLVFGIYHNFCVGNCWHLFRIEGNHLYGDAFDHPRNGEISFQSDPLPDRSYQLATPLLEIPDAIEESDRDTYGCPDCADQGGYYLEFKNDGVKRIVHFDTRLDAYAELTAVVDYVRLLADITTQLAN